MKLKKFVFQLCTRSMWCSSKMVQPHIGVLLSEGFLTCIFLSAKVVCDGKIPWAACSPDIAPLDFVLWGYVKNIVYKTSVTSLEALKLRIFAAIKRVAPQMQENFTCQERRAC
jgi:hypothetical protein